MECWAAGLYRGYKQGLQGGLAWGNPSSTFAHLCDLKSVAYPLSLGFLICKMHISLIPLVKVRGLEVVNQGPFSVQPLWPGVLTGAQSLLAAVSEGGYVIFARK